MNNDDTDDDVNTVARHAFKNVHGATLESKHDSSTTIHPSVPNTSRRTLLQGLAGVGGLALLPGGAAALGDLDSNGGPLSDTEGAGEIDPYTRSTYRAVADAMVPETPELAEELGEEHRSGGLTIELERFLIYSFNSFVPLNPGIPATNTGLNLRFAEQFAATLDGGAALLLATGRNEDALSLSRFPLGGPFAKLSRKDRFRAINLLERQDLQIESNDLLADLTTPLTDVLGADDLFEELTTALTPGMSVESLDGVNDELLNAPPGTSLDGLVDSVTERLADTPTSVGDVVDSIGDQIRTSPLGDDGLLDNITDYPGFIKFQIFGVNSFAQFGYYTEWSGYGDTKIACPSKRVFGSVDAVQSFTQTDYPGPARGYADFRGYEVAEFKEGRF